MSRAVALIFVPFDLERSRCGMGEAPGALQSAGLLAQLTGAGVRVSREVWIEGELGPGDTVARLARLQRRVADAVSAAVADGLTPVIIGGDCCTAIGMWSGLSRGRSRTPLDVAWFDAHGDWNTEETTLSGYIGGMPYAVICGHGNSALRRLTGLVAPAPTERCLLLGARDLDPPEAALLKTTAVRIVCPRELSMAGGAPFSQHQPAGELYLHLDIDVLDLNEAPGVTYPSPGGLSSAEAIRCCRRLIASTPLAGFTLAAVNPSRDPDGRTVATAIRLLKGVLGEAAVRR